MDRQQLAGLQRIARQLNEMERDQAIRDIEHAQKWMVLLNEYRRAHG